MSNLMIKILLIAILIGSGMTESNMAKQSSSENISREVSCEKGLKNVGKLKVGMKDSEVLDLLGKPTAISGETWSYNFWPCSPPPKIGVQAVIGVGLIFKEKVVSEIGWATICAMGGTGTRPKN